MNSFVPLTIREKKITKQFRGDLSKFHSVNFLDLICTFWALKTEELCNSIAQVQESRHRWGSGGPVSCQQEQLGS